MLTGRRLVILTFRRNRPSRKSFPNALTMYANKHDDFCDLMAEAAFDNLFDTILTDDLFKPVEGFTPTDEERAKMEEAEKTAKALSGLFNILKRF